MTEDKNGNQVETDENGYIVFNAPDASTVKELEIGQVNLNPFAKEACFYFTIESLMGGEGYIRVIFNTTYNIKENMTVDI